MISAVTFDVWETMIHDDERVSAERSALRIEVMRQALGRAGLDPGEAAMTDAYMKSWTSCEVAWSAGIEIDPHDQLLIILRHISLDLPSRLGSETIRELEEAYVRPIMVKPPLLQEGLVGALTALRDRGTRLGLICNTGRTPGYAMRELLMGYEVLHYFDALAFSNEERIRKPNAEMFRRVLRQLAVCPEAAVHVGDDLVADIQGAKDAGMRAVLIRPTCPERLPVPPDAHITHLDQLLSALQNIEPPPGGRP